MIAELCNTILNVSNNQVEHLKLIIIFVGALPDMLPHQICMA